MRRSAGWIRATHAKARSPPDWLAERPRSSRRPMGRRAVAKFFAWMQKRAFSLHLLATLSRSLPSGSFMVIPLFAAGREEKGIILRF